MTISSILIDCVDRFSKLLASKDLDPYDAEVRTDLWQDEMGRLRVWASNIGAHQTDQSSLDFRLRDASHVKDQTIKLLQGLQRTLKNLNEALAEPAPDNEMDQQFGDDGTEIQQIYKSLVDIVNCLFQMSMVIRHPTQHDRILGTKREDIDCFKPFDQRHVSEKYPLADCAVIDRLGAAISRRRAVLKYRERHREKLGRGIDLALGGHSDAMFDELSETIATEFHHGLPKIEDAASDSGISQTSYAETLLQGHGVVTLPPVPKESAHGTPFECPYCHYIITINGEHSWARHIFYDIMPYICVYPDCSHPNRLFTNRREWFRHLQNAHSMGLDSQTNLECPLCKETIPRSDHFRKHLGRHLEELALFAIPRTGADENADPSESKGPHTGADILSLDFGENSDNDDNDEKPSTTLTSKDSELEPISRSPTPLAPGAPIDAQNPHMTQPTVSSPVRGSLSYNPRKGEEQPSNHQSDFTERLNPDFARRPSNFYQVGRVIAAPCPEVAGVDHFGNHDNFTVTTYSQHFYHKIRRLVVVKEGSRSCTCLPIITYGGGGALKKGIDLSTHAPIVNVGSHPPSWNVAAGLISTIFYVSLSDPAHKMGSKSLINFTHVFSVEHSWCTKYYGDLTPASRADLSNHYRDFLFR